MSQINTDKIASNSGGTTALTIADNGGVTAAGNVGIGLTSPQELLHLKDGDIAVGNGTAGNNAVIGRIGFSTDSSNSRFIGMESFRLGDAANADLRFHTYGGDGNKGERMRIESSGRISKNGSFATSNTSDDFYWNTGTGSRFRFHSGITGSRNLLGFSNPNGQVGAIETNGSSTTYATSSDYRLKENVDYTWDATTRLKQLKPARFNFIADDTNTLVDGFLAHEVSSIVPEAISGAKDAVDADNNPDYQGIDQSKLVPLLVKTIQELEARITALEAK